jgi:hypothetical protein
MQRLAFRPRNPLVGFTASPAIRSVQFAQMLDVLRLGHEPAQPELAKFMTLHFRFAPDLLSANPIGQNDVGKNVGRNNKSPRKALHYGVPGGEGGIRTRVRVLP